MAQVGGGPRRCARPSRGHELSTLCQRSARALNPPDWASVYLGDRNDPTLAASAQQQSRDWYDDSANTTHSLPGITANDGGLGVYGITLAGAVTATPTRRPTCSGQANSSAGYCPKTWTATGFTYQLNEGVNDLSLTPTDIIDRTGTPVRWTEKIDRSQPMLGTPTGNLWDARERSVDHRAEGFYGDDATLMVPVSDAHSGVNEVVVLRDGVQWGPRATITSGTATWSTNLHDSLPDGRYRVEVVAHDNVWVAGSSTADRHEARSTPFYVVIDRSGDVVHARSVSGDLSQGGELDAEEWAQLSTNTARIVSEDQIETRLRETCADDATKQCDEYRSVTRRRENIDPSAPESFSRYTGRANDPGVPMAGDLASESALGDPEATGTTVNIAPPWQHLPPGRGASYVRFDFPDAYDDQPATYRSYLDAQTLLPLRGEVVDNQGTVRLITYWDYSVERRERSSYAGDFFKVPRPAQTSHSTEADLRQAEPMGPQQDMQTGTIFVPQFLGNVLDRVGLGVLCLVSSDYVRFSGASPQDEVHEDPDPTVPPAHEGARSPETLVSANYVLVPSVAGCQPGTGSVDEPDLDVVTMASASDVAGAWRQAYAEEGQVLDLVDGAHAYVVTRDDSKLSALVDLGQATVIVTAPIALGDVLPILQLLEPR